MIAMSLISIPQILKFNIINFPLIQYKPKISKFHFCSLNNKAYAIASQQRQAQKRATTNWPNAPKKTPPIPKVGCSKKSSAFGFRP